MVTLALITIGKSLYKTRRQNLQLPNCKKPSGENESSHSGAAFFLAFSISRMSSAGEFQIYMKTSADSVVKRLSFAYFIGSFGPLPYTTLRIIFLSRLFVRVLIYV